MTTFTEGKIVFTVEPMRLAYLIGRYPELSNTFIDREIGMLREIGGFEIGIVSIRRPLTLHTCSPEQQALHQETLYLLPERWADFRYSDFLAANLYFLLVRPLVYFGTLFELLTGPHPDFKARIMTILHFGQGIYASYLLRRKTFDHLHVHFMDRAVVAALIISRLLGKTYSFTAHAADIYTKPILMRLKMQKARFVVTVSQYNKDYLLETYPGIPAAKIHILHPWVNLAAFSPPTHTRSNGRLHILSVGRLVEKKGHADLIQACRMLRDGGLDLECRIVGEGPLRPEFETQIAAHGLQQCVWLEGGQPQERVRELLGTWADVFALPCVIAGNGDRDGIPVSLAEAMAMELPVVSTNLVGISELVCDGAGFLVPPHHPADLSKALEIIAAMKPEERVAMGQRGRAVVEAEFNLIKGTQELAKLFSTVAINKTPR